MEAFSFPTIKGVQHMGKLVCVTMYPKMNVKCAHNLTLIIMRYLFKINSNVLEQSITLKYQF